MNEHDLDAAIDDVAREMTAGDLDGAFRAHVLRRVEEQIEVRGSWFLVLGSWFGVRGSPFVVLGSAFAAAAIIVAAVVMFRGRPERAMPESPMAHAPAAPAASAQAGTGARPAPATRTWRPASAGPVTGTSEASQVEALAPPPLDVPSIALAELPAPESIQLDQMQTISSIAVAPLAAGDQGERR
jgi:hypothetical protein